VIAALYRGFLSQDVQQKLLADIDAQLLRLESEESDGAAEQEPSPDRAMGIPGRDTVTTTDEERKP
jgi:hypothetical protein